MKNSMYVIFGYDYACDKGHLPGSAILNGMGYGFWGPFDVFRADQCFASKNKAKSFIQKMLRHSKTAGGPLRPDVCYANFEIRQVYKCRNNKNLYVLHKEDIDI